MKKILFLVGCFLVVASIVIAATYPSGAWNVVSVSTNATLVWSGVTVNQSQMLGVFIQNQSDSVTVYCGPDNTITTGHAPLKLTPGAGYTFDYSGVHVYCIVSSSSANVGYMVLPKTN
jgi:hypothetical protein